MASARHDLRDAVRAGVIHYWHPVGTCALGSVTDADGHVLGVEGLVDADASVMPVTPRATTNLPTTVVANGSPTTRPLTRHAAILGGRAARRAARDDMERVIFQTSMSLDGFMTASEQTAEEPLGAGGEQLHDWAFDDPENEAYLARVLDHGGAVISGRVTYEHSLPWWGADGPSGAARIPVFVVTNRPPTAPPEGGVYTFVTEGIDVALDLAGEVAGEEDVVIVGGASIGRAYIAAGLVDELQIHLVPVLFGSGTRMFEDMGIGHLQLEPIEVVATSRATHLHYRLPRAEG